MSATPISPTPGETQMPPAEVLAWADTLAGMLGEENENTLIFEDDDQKMMQVHGDAEDDTDVPHVFLWWTDPDGRHVVSHDGHVEMQRNLNPSEALELAAALIVQATRSVEVARWRAEDRTDDAERNRHGR